MAEKPDPTKTSSKEPYYIVAMLIVATMATFVAAYRLGRSGSLVDVKPGDTAPVPSRSSLYDLVDPPEGAEWCVFVQGALVTALEVSEQNVLASYRATGTDERECPNDTKFVISKYEFTSLADQYERRKASQADRQELLNRPRNGQ